jgi:hypothetical protein
MKVKTNIAILLFIVALLSVIDWMVFSIKNESLKFNEIKSKYIERLPDSIQNFCTEHTGLITSFFMLCFFISGFILIKENNKIFKVIGAISFLLACWELFTLM